MIDEAETCPSVWIHNHGRARCELARGHEGEHKGTCWACLEDGEDWSLRWTDSTEDVA